MDSLVLLLTPSLAAVLARCNLLGRWNRKSTATDTSSADLAAVAACFAASAQISRTNSCPP
ncbi:hypothetical protein CBD41_05995 [bacterium TMED181]|nr:MAG: hypothetical protein CBD41_05995 [bacterium TMED181]